MSELYADDPFLASLDKAINGPPKVLAELTDPATGKKVPFEDQAKLQEAIQLMYNANMQAQAELRELKARAEAAPKSEVKSEPKVKTTKPDNEKLLAEFQKRTELDAVEGMDYFTGNLPTVQKLNEALAAVQQRQAQFEQALTATTFLGTNRDIASNTEAQKVIGQILTEMGLSNPSPKHYEIALAAAKSTAPQLFQPPAEPVRDKGFGPPPSPPRTATSSPAGNSTNADIERQINMLWDQPGGEQKVRDLLNSMAG